MLEQIKKEILEIEEKFGKTLTILSNKYEEDRRVAKESRDFKIREIKDRYKREMEEAMSFIDGVDKPKLRYQDEPRPHKSSSEIR